jgi:hypothetical protein
LVAFTVELVCGASTALEPCGLCSGPGPLGNGPGNECVCVCVCVIVYVCEV